MVHKEEKIYAWKPIEGLEGEFHIYSTTFDSKGLKIVLYKDIDPKKGVLLDFSGSVVSYRETDELLAMHLLESPYIPPQGYQYWFFYKVENSEYLKWVSHQLAKANEYLNLVHYAIWTEDWIIDVLARAEPDVKLIDIND
jgi:hypothetical protein